MERRFTPAPAARVALTERADKQPTIVGYAAVYYRADDPATEYQLWEGAVERILPGAFDRAIAEDDVRGLFNHDRNQVLGRKDAQTLRLISDDVGLGYEIDAGDTTCARDVVEHLRRRDVSGSSFAFMITDQNWRTEAGIDIREITGVQLWDVGPVTYPAYAGTAAAVRAAADEVAEARAAHAAWRAQSAPDPQLAARLAHYRARAVEIQEHA